MLCVALLVGGRGERLGGDKPFFLLEGRPLLEHALELADLLCSQLPVTRRMLVTHGAHVEHDKLGPYRSGRGPIEWELLDDCHLGQARGPLQGIVAALLSCGETGAEPVPPVGQAVPANGSQSHTEKSLSLSPSPSMDVRRDIEWILVLPVDMPRLQVQEVLQLWDARQPCKWAVLPFLQAIPGGRSCWEVRPRQPEVVPSGSGQIQPLVGLYHKDAFPSLVEALENGMHSPRRWAIHHNEKVVLVTLPDGPVWQGVNSLDDYQRIAAPPQVNPAAKVENRTE